MSLTELSVENGLCRCCLAEGDFKNLGHTFIINEEEEVYSRMLRECFGITINPVAGEYSQSTYSICEKCLKTLREANIFKKMVIESEIKFQHLLSTSFIKDLKPIKVELDEVIISADENKDDNNGGVRDTHIDDDDFRYPCSDEDDKSTLELKLELEPTSKKPKTEVKKDTQPYKTKLRKKKTTKESASVPQKKTRKGSDTESEYECGASGPSSDEELCAGIMRIKCLRPYSRRDFRTSERQSTDNESLRLNKAPKTSAERGREFRARKALLKQQSKQQQKPDARVEIAAEDADLSVSEISEIRAIEKKAKSAEATRRWRERKRGFSESAKKRAKTAAERMREYRERRKLAKKILLKQQSDQDLDDVAK